MHSNLSSIPMTSDFTATGSKSNSTTITVAVSSPAARALFADRFGVGCVSVEMPDNRFGEFFSFIRRKGMTVSFS